MKRVILTLISSILLISFGTAEESVKHGDTRSNQAEQKSPKTTQEAVKQSPRQHSPNARKAQLKTLIEGLVADNKISKKEAARIMKLALNRKEASKPKEAKLAPKISATPHDPNGKKCDKGQCPHSTKTSPTPCQKECCGSKKCQKGCAKECAKGCSKKCDKGQCPHSTKTSPTPCQKECCGSKECQKGCSKKCNKAGKDCSAAKCAKVDLMLTELEKTINEAKRELKALQKARIQTMKGTASPEKKSKKATHPKGAKNHNKKLESLRKNAEEIAAELQKRSQAAAKNKQELEAIKASLK